MCAQLHAERRDHDTAGKDLSSDFRTQSVALLVPCIWVLGTLQTVLNEVYKRK